MNLSLTTIKKILYLPKSPKSPISPISPKSPKNKMWIKENKTFIKMVMKVIPSYCKGYKKEYIYLLEINKKCENLLEIIETEEVFSS